MRMPLMMTCIDGDISLRTPYQTDRVAHVASMQSPSVVSRFSTENVPIPPVATRSPFRGTLALSMRSPARVSREEIVDISSDDSPVPRIHPFFLPGRGVGAEEGTHEMRFHALARQQPVPQPVLIPSVPAFPTNRQEGRLRRRVSTPPLLQPQAPIVWIPPPAPRPHGRPGITRTPLSDQLLNLVMTTPEHDLAPTVLFPDSPVPSVPTRDAWVQTSPRLVHDMHQAVRDFLIGLGF